MFIYRSLPSEVIRKYKTPQGVVRRIQLDFPDDEHVYYTETETEPNMAWRWEQSPRPTVQDIRNVAKQKAVLVRKVFFNCKPYLGWQLHGSEIIIWWEDE